MIRNTFQFEYSTTWILLVILVAGGLCFWLYQKKGLPWSSSQNLLLASLRFLGIFFLLILLLEPTLRSIQNTDLPPTIHLLIDNSSSVSSRGVKIDQILSEQKKIEEELNAVGLETSVFTLNDSSTFSAASSDLAGFLKRTVSKDRDENQIASILISDGIYNQGISPTYQNYIKPIFTIGVGDTVPPQDISITRTLFNKVSYKENQSPVRIEISQSGFFGKRVKVTISEKGKVLASKEIVLERPVQEVEFQVSSEIEGLRRMIVSVSELENESSYANNYSNLFMEVIDGRRKVLIVASSPHPDIKAIRTTLNQTGNYQTELYIPSIQNQKPTDNFDVIIYHGAFRSRNPFEPKGNPGIFYILSNESSIRSINMTLPYLQINRKGSQPDKVTGSFNANFSKFKIEKTGIFDDFPPIEVPFGDYILSGPSEVVMFQKIGNFKTEKPLMAVYDDGSQKSAVLVGQNIWTWKMQESAINGESEEFNNLITKTVQYLSVSSKQKPFQLTPEKRSFRETEPVIFEAEVYNDIFERIYGNDIRLEIVNEAGQTNKYNFTDSEISSDFKTPTLDPGIYTYIAQTERGGKTLTDRGEFSVTDTNLESLDLTADHGLLRTLAAKSGGIYAPIEKSADILNEIKNRNYKSRIKSEEKLIPLYRLWWWYLIVFVLFSTEWFLRKYWGAY